MITGIGGDISQGVATILRESRPDLKLVGVDMHAQHGGRLFVNCFETVPGASNPEYLSALQAVIAKHAVDILIPMSEPELDVLRSPTDLFPGVKRITAGDGVIAAGLDKLTTIRALVELGLPVPWTIPVGDAVPPAYPCILKSRLGSGSRTVFRIENAEDAEYFAKRHPDAVFQELLEPADREITCAVYRRRDGEVSSLLMLRRLTGGFTGWAKIIEDEQTSQMCTRIADGLDLRGSMNVQLRLTDKGPRVFEINPRFSSTVLMRHRIGFSDVLWAIDEAEGKPVSFPQVSNNKIMVRVQAAAVFDTKEAEDRQWSK
ncbi:MAG: ATP-grasp domain-containing protein [Pseudomonadota bacterium]